MIVSQKQCRPIDHILITRPFFSVVLKGLKTAQWQVIMPAAKSGSFMNVFRDKLA